MSKQTRVFNKKVSDLENKIKSLKARKETAPSTVARESYSKLLAEAERDLRELKSYAGLYGKV